MAVPIGTPPSSHSSLKRMTALLESFGGLSLGLPILFSIRDEGIEGLDLVLQVLDDELDHDRIVEVAKSWNAVGDQIIGISEIRQCIHDTLAVRALEPPILVLEHGDQLAELSDSLPDELGRVRFLDLDEEGLRLGEHDIFFGSAGPLADLLQHLSEMADVFVAEFE